MPPLSAAAGFATISPSSTDHAAATSRRSASEVAIITAAAAVAAVAYSSAADAISVAAAAVTVPSVVARPSSSAIFTSAMPHPAMAAVHGGQVLSGWLHVHSSRAGLCSVRPKIGIAGLRRE